MRQENEIEERSEIRIRRGNHLMFSGGSERLPYGFPRLRVLGARVPRARVCPLGALTLGQAGAGRACACRARARSGHPHATPGNPGVLPRIVHVEIPWPWCYNNFNRTRCLQSSKPASHTRVRHFRASLCAPLHPTAVSPLTCSIIP